MMKTIAFGLVVTLSAASLLLSAPQSAQAGKFKGRINSRQVRQQGRIYQGAHSGQLTGKENLRLQKKEAKLAAREAKMRASGNGLTLKERAKLEAGQDALSGAIYKQKHDAQTR